MKSRSISSKDKKSFLAKALKAADWYVNAQIRCDRPWKSDHGRFPYYYYIPGKQTVPGFNWTHGRALFVLTEAYRITGDTRYLDSMELGAAYVRALQPMDPYYAITHGVFHEEIPQAPWGGILDGAQAASGLLMLHKVTGEHDYLRRGRAFCEFLLRTWRPDFGLAQGVKFKPERVNYHDDSGWMIHQASALPLWHLFNITGEGQFLPLIVDAASRVLRSQREDGALMRTPSFRQTKAQTPNQHDGWGEGDERFVVRNDDGVVGVVLAAWKITGDRKYLDAMVRYADWIVENEPHERPFCAFGIQAANVLDIGRAAGKDYTSWVLDHIAKRCLALQASGTGDVKADGGFRGEDEEGNTGIFGGVSLDYVPTRTTCYMVGLLMRLSGKGTGAGFDVNG